MAQNIFTVPEQLYKDDLPEGFRCNLYIGRMTGQLRPLAINNRFSQFSFEMVDALDPTEMVLRYNTMEAPAEELARWENLSDTVGIVIAFKGDEMFMVEAYNFTRNKWFGTAYYPHRLDKSPVGNISYSKLAKMTPAAMLVGFAGILCCGIGAIVVGVTLWAGIQKTQQYKVINPDGYRRETAQKIANWIATNAAQFASSGNPSIDPSL